MNRATVSHAAHCYGNKLVENDHRYIIITIIVVRSIVINHNGWFLEVTHKQFLASNGPVSHKNIKDGGVNDVHRPSHESEETIKVSSKERKTTKEEPSGVRTSARYGRPPLCQRITSLRRYFFTFHVGIERQSDPNL